jgi:phosphopentomutase
MAKRGPKFRRVAAVILDGVGIGAQPDAAAFGDEGSDSLGNVVRVRGGVRLPHLATRGLGRLTPLPGFENATVEGAWGKSTMASAGKDSTSGHWEFAGLVFERGFPLFPDGFPAEAVGRLREATGREFIGNKAVSGTEIIEELGAKHLKTGALILYTSADSVCQIAAHVDAVPLEELYEIGARSRAAMTGPYAVGRVIVRPFAGAPGSFRRLNESRRDYSLPPPAETLLDLLLESGLEVRGVGKVDDMFAGRGFSRCRHTRGNADGITGLKDELRDDFKGLLLANLNDTDTVYGHRNDPAGYASALEEFDEALPSLEGEMKRDDLILILSDHGNDPTTPSTDHSREFTPLIAWRPGFAGEVALGTRETLADVGQTIADNFAVGPLAAGTSFLDEIRD